MNELPKDQQERFDDAVRAFREQEPVRVTAEKISAFLEATGATDFAVAVVGGDLSIGLFSRRCCAQQWTAVI